MTAVSVSSEVVFVGQQFAIRAQTNIPAHSVHLAIDGKKHPMAGSGTSWHYTTSVAKPGELNYRVSARNKEGRESQPKASSITIARKIVDIIRVARLELNPRKGVVGSNFSFKAETDDLRESPIVQVVSTLIGKGYELSIYDRNINWGELFGSNLGFLEHEIPYAKNLKAAGQSKQAFLVLQQASVLHGNDREIASEYGRFP